MDNNATVERIKSLLAERNITAKRMLADLGLGPNYMAHIRDAKYKPNKIGLIAEYLGVTEDYLLGTEQPSEEIDPRYIQLVEAVRKMSPDQVDAWLALLEHQQGGQ